MSSEQNPHGTTSQEMVQEMQILLERILHKLRQHLHQPQTRNQLANGQIFVLMMLFKQEICKASDIASQLGVTSGAVTGLTDKLVNLGLMKRIRSEEDRRVVHFSLTEKGIETAKAIRQERLEKLVSLFTKLEHEDLEKMLDVFTKLNAVLD
jgi:DNA-binding MarR family transcriptional regulator